MLYTYIVQLNYKNFKFRKKSIKRVFYNIGKAVKQVKSKAEDGNNFTHYINVLTEIYLEEIFISFN